MGKNPTFITNASGTVSWYYRAPITELRRLLAGPEHWVLTRVMSANRACAPSMLNYHVVQFCAQPEKWNELMVSGTCGTAPIEVKAKVGSGSIGDPAYDPEQGDRFWQDFETVLAFVSPSSAIDIDIVEAADEVKVHLELGSDRTIHSYFMFAVAVSQQGFIEWLLNTAAPKIKRIVTYTKADGSQVAIPLANIVFVPKRPIAPGKDELAMTYEHQASDGCVYPCVEVACNGLKAIYTVTGDGSAADPFKFTCELQSMLTKTYCINVVSPQAPCPPA